MNEKKIIYSHDPREYIRMLKQILVSDSKKIAFLCGAGTSITDKRDKKLISAMHEMTDKIIGDIKKTCKFTDIMEDIEKDLKEKGDEFQLENILSNITQKASIIGNGVLSGLNKGDFEELKKNIENQIKENVSIHNQERGIKIKETPHFDFATWIVQASRKCPVEIFTTNYDYLFEMALEEHDAPYFDGFVGGFTPFFYADSVESDDKNVPEWTRLWKIHGSLGWKYDNGKIVKGRKDDGDIMIYPSTLKYNHSKKEPYASLIDRLKSFVKQDDSVLFILGYSFGDQHINETILNALSKSRISHVYVFKNGDLKEDSNLAQFAIMQKKLSVYGKRHAVIGGVYGEWNLKNEPQKEDSIDIDVYFDEDGTIPDQEWIGKGDFILGDFKKFTNFLTVLGWSNYTHKDEKSDNYGH